MIVRRQNDRWVCITQPDHAALAGRLMREWQLGGLPSSPRRDDILHAIDAHDNGWQEVDAFPLVDPAGVVLDFVHAPLEMRRGVWPRGVRRLAGEPYAAALVANHAVHVFARYRGQSEWVPFFDEMTTLRSEMLEDSGLSPETLLDDYAFVRLGDLLSLTFCNAWTDAQDEFGIAIRLDGTRLVVTPDPFAGRAVPFEIAARVLSSHDLSPPATAPAAWARAERHVLTGTAAGR
jgi:hypothetical protein